MDWSAKVHYFKRDLVTVARQIDYLFKQLWGKVILSIRNPIGQVLYFDDRTEFQNRGTERMHVPSHIADALKIDKNEDSEVVEVIEKYITCALHDETKFPEMGNLVKIVQTRYHTSTCRKKKGVASRFNAPWAPSDKSRIVRSEEKIDKNIVKQSKKY